MVRQVGVIVGINGTAVWGGGRCMHRDLVMIKGCAVLRFFLIFFFFFGGFLKCFLFLLLAIVCFGIWVVEMQRCRVGLVWE